LIYEIQKASKVKTFLN